MTRYCSFCLLQRIMLLQPLALQAEIIFAVLLLIKQMSRRMVH